MPGGSRRCVRDTEWTAAHVRRLADSRQVLVQEVRPGCPWQPTILRLRAPESVLTEISEAAGLETMEWLVWGQEPGIPQHLHLNVDDQQLWTGNPPPGFRLIKAWDWEHEPQAMAHMWKASIDAQKNFEVVWSVGLRGLTDSEYTACGDDLHKCAAAINEAVGNQTAWIREAQKNWNSTMIFYLFGSAAQMMNKGLLKLDEDVHFLLL